MGACPAGDSYDCGPRRLIAGPGVAKGECREPVSLLDLYPTLCHQSGATAKHPLAGEDLSPVLAGEQWQRREPVISIWGKWEKDTPDGARVAFSLRNKTHRYSCY
jgi:arylsulfatase A-like enzyme